jgi:ribose transport system permease protein
MNATPTSSSKHFHTTVTKYIGRVNYAAVPAVLVAVLLATTLFLNTGFLSPANIAVTLAVSSPLIISALAQSFALLSGNHGLDLSVGPVLGFTTVLIAGVLVPSGIVSAPLLVPLVLLFGLTVGMFNGVLVAYVRLPAIIATLATYLIFEGLSAEVMPTPGGEVPDWLVQLTRNVGPIPGVLIVYAALLTGWLILLRSAYVRNLLAVGGDDRAAYTAGIDVSKVRLVAFALSGLLASVGGLVLAGTIHSGDARVGAVYTVTSITAVALGGISLRGGRGGMLGAALGGVAYFVIQHLLTVAHVSVFQLQVASGAVLILALALNGYIDSIRKRRSHAQAVSPNAEPNSEPQVRQSI